MLPELFPSGHVVATPGAIERIEDAYGDDESRAIVLDLLARHQSGDWGTVDSHDAAANVAAIRDDERVVSSYDLPTGRVWIITEADRSLTTLMLPGDC